MTLAKPLLRGFLSRQIKRDLITAFGIGAVSCTLFKIFVVDKAKQEYADFYATYDPYADYERMKKLGLFTSARPE